MNHLPPAQIVPLDASQREQAAQVLTAAFQDDFMYRRIFGSAEQCQGALRSIWGGVLDYCLAFGEVYTTPAMEGVIGWLGPGETDVTLWRLLRSGRSLLGAVLRMPPRQLYRFLAVMKRVDALHGRTMKQPHWYLWLLGVAPAHQGRGIGSSLLRPLLARADETGLPCYLETQTEGNVAFYRRRGFAVLREMPLPYGIKIWTMLREPRGDKRL